MNANNYGQGGEPVQGYPQMPPQPHGQYGQPPMDRASPYMQSPPGPNQQHMMAMQPGVIHQGVYGQQQQQQPDYYADQPPPQAYPQTVPDEIRSEVNKKEKPTALNCLPRLKGKTDRQRFVIKVYSILSVQVLITVLWVAAVYKVEPLQEFVATHPVLFWVSFGLSIAILIALMCFWKLARKVPLNYILLFSYTAVETYMIAAICIFYPVETLLIAASLTLGLFVGLTIYAIYTKADITILGGLLFGMSMVLLVAILIGFLIQSPILTLVIAAAACILVCIFIIYDTQLIVGGRKYQLSMDDYIIGALLLYTDIITLFLWLLSLLGGGGGGRRD